MFGIRPLRKAIGPSFWSMDLTHSPMPMEETVTRDLTVSMGWVSAVPHIEATLPPSILCQALISISSELLMIASLILSNTKNSTALVGAILATLREFPLKSPMGPSVLAILASVPTKPSCLAFKEFTMYSIFTRSSGATTDRETPPETAPASRCFATDLPVLFTVSPFIFMYRPLDCFGWARGRFPGRQERCGRGGIGGIFSSPSASRRPRRPGPPQPSPRPRTCPSCPSRWS